VLLVRVLVARKGRTKKEKNRERLAENPRGKYLSTYDLRGGIGNGKGREGGGGRNHGVIHKLG